MQPCVIEDQSGAWRTSSGARIILLAFLGVLSTIAPARVCFGQVQLPTVNLGETNFEDAFAAPGWFLQEFPESYVAGELRDGNGNKIPGKSRLIVDSTTTHVVFVSQKRVLGAWLAGEVLQPLVDLNVRSTSGTSSSVRGFGDMTFGPGLQWAPKKVGSGVFVHASFSMSLFRPGPTATGGR